MHNLFKTAADAQRGGRPWLLANFKGTQPKGLGHPEESLKHALPSPQALHTTKVGPKVFVVSHGEVLKSREGRCVAAVQVGYVTQGAPPGDTNRYCYVWLGTSGFPLMLKQANKLQKMVIKNK